MVQIGRLTESREDGDFLETTPLFPGLILDLVIVWYKIDDSFHPRMSTFPFRKDPKKLCSPLWCDIYRVMTNSESSDCCLKSRRDCLD